MKIDMDKCSIQKLSLSSVHVNNYNPNRMDETQVLALRENMDRYGYRALILVRPDHEQGGFAIVDGEHRYKELIQNGIVEADFMVQDMTVEDAMLSTLSMNSVHGEVDSVLMAQNIIELNQRGVTMDEIMKVTGYSAKELDEFNEINLPPTEREIGPDLTEGVPPLLVTVALVDENTQETYHAAIERAMTVMMSPDAIPMIGEQAVIWDKAMRRGHRMSGTKMKGKALEFILRAFLAIKDPRTLIENLPVMPEGEPSLDVILKDAEGNAISEDDKPKIKSGGRKNKSGEAAKAKEKEILNEFGMGGILDSRLEGL